MAMEGIEEIVSKTLKDIERKLRENGISPKLCDWKSIENKVRQDVIRKMSCSLETRTDTNTSLHIGKYQNLPISVTYEQLSKVMPNENIISTAIESLENATKALDGLSAKRVIHDDLPSTIIAPILWDTKVLKERVVIPMKESEFEANYMCVWKFKVENIIFNDPATILFMNGKKFVSKCHDEPFSETKGLLMCLAKAYGCTHSKIKAKLKRRGMEGNQTAIMLAL